MKSWPSEKFEVFYNFPANIGHIETKIVIPSWNVNELAAKMGKLWHFLISGGVDIKLFNEAHLKQRRRKLKMSGIQCQATSA